MNKVNKVNINKKISQCFALLTLFTLFTLPTLSAKEVGGDPGQIWHFGTDSRSFGLANAMVSIVNDSAAGYWNSSRLATLDQPHFGFLSTSLLEGAKYDYLGFSYPSLTHGAFGFNLVRLGIDGIERRDISNNLSGNYGFSVAGYSLGWATQFTDHLYLGGNVKYLNRQLAEFKSTLTSLDLSANVALTQHMDSAVVLRDVVFSGSNTSDKLPQNFVVGTSYRFFQDSLRFTLQFEQIGFVIKSGIEYNFGPAAFRLGLGENALEGGGFGFQYRGMHLDYALRMHPVFGNTSSLSFGFGFGKSRIEERKIQTKHYSSKATEAYEHGKLAQANKMFKKALDFSPRDVILEKRKQQVETLQKLLKREAVEYQEPPETASNETKAQYKAMQSNLTDYIENETERGTAKFKLARAEGAFLDGKLGLAMRYSQEAVEMEPDNTLAYERLGSVYFSLGFRKEALQMWNKSLAINPTNEVLKDFLRKQQLEVK